MHDNYHYDEFISVRYYDTSGNYGSAEIDAALGYYNITSFPTLVFNGDYYSNGGGDVIASGVPYLSIIESFYFDSSPVKIEFDSFDQVTGAVSVTVTMLDPEFEITNGTLKMRVIEDEVTGNDHHVTRDIIDLDFSLSGQNNTFEADEVFEYPGGVDPENVFAVAFVQLPDHDIIQSACTYPVPDYRARVIYEADQVLVGPSEGIFDTDDFSVYNTGLDDTFTVTVVTDEAPDGSMVTFCDDIGNCFPETTSVTVEQDNEAVFHANIIPGGSGMIKFHFEVVSDNMENPLIFPLTYITDDVQALLVDDDGGEPFEEYFTSALDALNMSYGIWDLASSKLPLDLVGEFDILIWNVGWAFPSLDEEDRAFLETYIDAGGNLFLSGQDIGWDLNESSNNVDISFYNNYLHADYISDDVNWYDLQGLDDDPVSNDLNLHIEGGDGANNQDYPSHIAAYDDSAVEILFYTNNGNPGAIRAVHPGSNARIVYFAFGFEAVDNPDDRSQALGQVMGWLQGGIGNFVPIVSGSDYDLLAANTELEITLENLEILDYDNDFPDDFTLYVNEGENYTVAGNTVTPDLDYAGILYVEIQVSDGLDLSEAYEIELLVYWPGDTNGDNNVDVLDIVRLVNLILNIDTPEEQDFIGGDMNGDGGFSVLDIIQIINIIIGGNVQRFDTPEHVVLIQSGGQIQIEADGQVAGLQLTLAETDFEIEWQLPSGWDIHRQDQTVLLFSTDGSGISRQVIAQVQGEFDVQTALAGGLNSKGIQAEIISRPSAFLAGDAYPNPFNPRTSLNYELQTAGPVRIAVYNLQGQMMTELVNEVQTAGRYSVEWDASQMPSGTYLMEIHAGGDREVQKLTLLK